MATAKKTKRRLTPEGKLKAAVVRQLKKREEAGELVFWRSNAGVGFTKSGFMITFGRKGMPDMFVLKAGVLYAIELKSEHGSLEESQKELRPKLEAAGCVYHVIRSVEELVEAIS